MHSLTRTVRTAREKTDRRMKGDTGEMTKEEYGGKRRRGAKVKSQGSKGDVRGKREVKDIGNRGIRELRTVRTVAAADRRKVVVLGGSTTPR